VVQAFGVLSLRGEESAMIAFMMIGALAILAFLCVASSLAGYGGRRLL
jgi:hypothetical protein